MANSVDPDQTAPRSSLIWICTVCPGISVRKLRIIMVKSQIKQKIVFQSFLCWRCVFSNSCSIQIKDTFAPRHDKTNKMTSAPFEDSDQPGHPPSQIRVFAVRSVGSLRPKVSTCGQRMPRMIWVCAGRTCNLLVLSWGGLYKLCVHITYFIIWHESTTLIMMWYLKNYIRKFKIMQMRRSTVDITLFICSTFLS